MRKGLLILTVLLLLKCVSFASDEVYLDLSIPERQRYNIGEYQYENKKSDNYDETDENYLKPSFQTIWQMFKEDILTKEKSDK